MTKLEGGGGQSTVIGQPIDRLDGRLKVTGQARYSAEWPLENVAYAHAIQSAIPKGKISKFDSAAAQKAPGVLAVYSYANKPATISKAAREHADRLFLLQDNQISYAGQIIGMVVAETLEQAKHAASLVKVEYAVEPFVTTLESQMEAAVLPEGCSDVKRGNFEKGLSQSAATIDATYITPTETHNPMEPFATIAAWSGDRLTLYDTTQGVYPTRGTIANVLSLQPEQVRVVSHFLGGGFGSKLMVWSQVPLAAMAARKLQRPVKFVLDRNQMYGPVGCRPQTIQQITLGATREGKLLAVRHTGKSETSRFHQYVEAFCDTARMLYACDNVQTGLRIVPLDMGQATWMRAPGHATGSFALESALDELAYELNIDPLQLRLLNYAQKDNDSGLPWSSNAVRQCCQIGAERFGWHNRSSKPAAKRDGKTLIGYGMATAQHSVWRNPATVAVSLLADGTAVVRSATQDIGTGTYTVMTQVAADRLSLPLNKVHFELGDTDLPKAPISGGSTTAGSVGGAVARACDAAIARLTAAATGDAHSPLHQAQAQNIIAANGRLQLKDNQTVGESFAAIVARRPEKAITVKIDNKPDDQESKFSMSAFGAQFAEVRVDPDLANVQVSRFVGVYDCGRILNAKTARSQAMGGIVFGIGMALMEHTWIDHNLGRIVNADLAEYHVPVNPDVGSIEVEFVQPDDPHVNALGAKGAGEVGITGAAAAIANAVFNATGRRVRDLPITLDKLL